MTIFSAETISAWSSSPYALAIISLLSFSESAFFIIPPEVMFIPMALADKSTAIWLSLFISLSSIFGAVFGYFVGQKGGKPILYKLFSQTKIDKVKILYHKYDAWAVAMAAFTPIPFKVFTVSAGVFDIDFKRFLIAASLGRTARYLLLGMLIYVFGDTIRYFLEHQLDKFLLVSTVFLIFGFLVYRLAYPKLESKLTHESLLVHLKHILRPKN